MNRNTMPCKGCKSPIRFVRTPAGKWLPCEPDLLDSDDLDVGEKLVTTDGEVKAVEAGESFQGYLPHWAVCPKADHFRKGGSSEK